MTRSLSLLAKVLTRVGTQTPLADVLSDLALFAECIAPELHCSILLVDPTTATLRAAAGPSLGNSFQAECDGQPIGEAIGACAAAAAHGAIVTAMPADPMCFSRCRSAANSRQFGSCWSAPFYDDEQVLIGVFSLYRRSPGEPSREQATVLRIGARLAGLVVVRHREAARLRASAAELIDASDRRRARTAVHLHEGIAQELASAALLLSHAVPRVQPSDAAIAADLQRIEVTLRGLVGTLRTLATSLAPVAPGELRLTLALDGLAARIRSHAGINVRRRLNPTVDELLDGHTAVQLYRIAEEAAENAVRHAAARTLTLVTAVRPESIVIEVADDGAGMPDHPDQIARAGIVGMRTRAARMGGRLEIESATAGGTTVRARVPLAGARQIEAHGTSHHGARNEVRRKDEPAAG